MMIYRCEGCGAELGSGAVSSCPGCRRPNVLSGSLPVKDINVLLRGVGKDAPITVNATGGKQSATHYFFRGLPPLALVAVAKIMEEAAAKYEAPDNVYADPTDRNWHKIEDWEHIEHAFMHLVADLAGDTQDEHLEHALTRLMMAVHQRHAKKGAP